MKDYVRGAFETLVWVEGLLKEGDVKNIKREVRGALKDIKKGIGIDFRQRLRGVS